MYNDRTFYMVVLVGYSVTGRCGLQWADVVFLGNRVSLQVSATIVAGQAVTRGETVSLSRALDERRIKV